MRKYLFAAIAVIGVAVSLAIAAPILPSSAAETSQIRMRHLALEVPPVDVYMAGLDGSWHIMLKGVGYGETSPYLTVTPGTYGVALRPAGAPPKSTPAVKGTVEIGEGKAYTFQATGSLTALEQKLLVDGPAGKAGSAEYGVQVGPVDAQPAPSVDTPPQFTG